MKLLELNELSFSAVEIGLHFVMIYKAALECITKHGQVEIHEDDEGKRYSSMIINSSDIARVIDSWPIENRGSMSGHEAVNGINISIVTGIKIRNEKGQVKAGSAYNNNVIIYEPSFFASKKSHFYSILKKEKSVLLHEVTHLFQTNIDTSEDYLEQIHEIEARFMHHYYDVMLILYDAITTKSNILFRLHCIKILYFAAGKNIDIKLHATIIAFIRYFNGKTISEVLNEYGPHGKVMREIRDMLEYKRKTEGWI
jgi:hypothetical protein